MLPEFDEAAEVADLFKLLGGEAGARRAAEIGERKPLLFQVLLRSARIVELHVAFERVEDDLHAVRPRRIGFENPHKRGQRVGEEVCGDAAESGAAVPQRIGQSGQVRVVDFQFGSGDGGALGAELFPVAAGVFQEPERGQSRASRPSSPAGSSRLYGTGHS